MTNAAYTRVAVAQWQRDTNITDASRSIAKEASEAYSKLKKELSQEAQKFDPNQIQDADVKRKMERIRSLGSAALSATKLSQFLNITDSMTNTYRYSNYMDKHWCLFRQLKCLTEIGSNCNE